MQLANGEISDNELYHLCNYFTVSVNVNEAEIYLSPKKHDFTAEELLEAMQIVGKLQPDDCDFEDGQLVLWWD